MKKLLGCALALMMLTACGSKDEGESAAKETKKCTVTMAGMDVQANVTGTDDAAETIVYTISFKSMGFTEEMLATITQEQLDEIGKQTLKQLGIEEGKGVELVLKAEEDDAIMTITADLKDGDADALKSLGITGDLKISSIVATMEANGGTCQ